MSTYTVLGFTGYGVANLVCALLAAHWQLTMTERLVAFFVPPVAFIVVVTIASAVVGRERIVFYQTTLAGIGLVAAVGALANLHVARLLDLVTIGIGIFLVFGRVGCFSVACCHGTLGRGVRYGRAHVAIGFWRRWLERELWPVQLAEAIASAVLVALAVWFSAKSGTAACIYIAGYSACRFGLELLRGDSPRPYRHGLSEAQYFSLGGAFAIALWRPSLWTISIAALLALASVVLVARRRQRELTLPAHLREIDRLLEQPLDGTRRETRLGLALSSHVLADGRVDWVMSASHPAWNAQRARQLAHALWPAFELVEGRTPGVIHVLIAPAAVKLSA